MKQGGSPRPSAGSPSRPETRFRVIDGPFASLSALSRIKSEQAEAQGLAVYFVAARRRSSLTSPARKHNALPPRASDLPSSRLPHFRPAFRRGGGPPRVPMRKSTAIIKAAVPRRQGEPGTARRPALSDSTAEPVMQFCRSSTPATGPRTDLDHPRSDHRLRADRSFTFVTKTAAASIPAQEGPPRIEKGSGEPTITRSQGLE